MRVRFANAFVVCVVGWALGRLQERQPEHPPHLSAVLVTGATSGIGKAATLALLSEGFVVYAGVRNAEAARELEKAHGPRLRPVLLDVSQPQQIYEAYATITQSEAAGGAQLVGLVNNAGSTYKRPLETADIGSVRELFETNVLGALAITQRFLPLLRRARGRIVNVGSVQGIISMPMQGPYAATKHALEALSDTLRQELAPLGVSVSMVNPGYINTGIRAKGSPARSNASLTEIEQRVYYQQFEALWRKDSKHATLAPPCCPQTDAAILHALMDPNPRTRYYPNTAAVALGDAFPAWLAAIIIRLFSVLPSLDRLKDLVVSKLF